MLLAGLPLHAGLDDALDLALQVVLAPLLLLLVEVAAILMCFLDSHFNDCIKRHPVIITVLYLLLLQMWPVHD